MTVTNSLYEQFNPLTTVAKTRFWDWFSGDVLNSSIWTTAHTGTGSGAMDDSLDGGYKLQTGATINSNARFAMQNVNQFKEDAAKITMVLKLFETTSLLMATGFVDSITLFGHFASPGFDSTLSATEFILLTKDGSTQTFTASDLKVNTNYNIHQLELTSPNSQYSINYRLHVTKTTNLPAADLQPYLRIFDRAASNRSLSCTYLEVYNT